MADLGAGELDLFEAVFNGSFEYVPKFGSVKGRDAHYVPIVDPYEWVVRGSLLNGADVSTGEVYLWKTAGWILPTHGKRMLVLKNNKVGASTVTMELTQAFDVQPGVTSLPITLDLCFITEEKPAGPGALVDDWNVWVIRPGVESGPPDTAPWPWEILWPETPIRRLPPRRTASSRSRASPSVGRRGLSASPTGSGICRLSSSSTPPAAASSSSRSAIRTGAVPGTA